MGCKVECEVLLLLSLVCLHFSSFRHRHPLPLGLGLLLSICHPHDTCKVQAGRGVNTLLQTQLKPAPGQRAAGEVDT